MNPTHTHITAGGRYALVAEHAGGGELEGQRLVVYHDLGKDCQSATTADDWRQHWRAVEPDDCTVCMGSGADQIKGNSGKPCGGCYGMGKVQANGERPDEMWQLAGIAGGIISRLRLERDAAVRQLSDPAVQSVIERRRQDVTTRLEQEWRAGRGKGPGGQRFVGD